jgi:hypothetical protein
LREPSWRFRGEKGHALRPDTLSVGRRQLASLNAD